MQKFFEDKSKSIVTFFSIAEEKTANQPKNPEKYFTSCWKNLKILKILFFESTQEYL